MEEGGGVEGGGDLLCVLCRGRGRVLIGLSEGWKPGARPCPDPIHHSPRPI